MICDTLQNHIFLNTLCRRLLICNRIACTAMEKSVIPSCGTVSDIMTLNQQSPKTSQRTVARCSGSRNAASDDDDIELVVIFTGHYIILFLLFY